MKARAYIIAYDIADERRLRRVHHYLEGQALHLQYSVFVAHLTRKGIKSLVQELLARIDERADDVRVYPLPENPQWIQLGEAPLPEAVHLLGGDERDVLMKASR